MAGISSRYRGTARLLRKKWAGTWYKPWTWRRIKIYVYDDLKFVEVSVVRNPPPGCEFENRARIEAVLLRSDQPTANGRLYPEETLRKMT
jgi:hypothetical protein